MTSEPLMVAAPIEADREQDVRRRIGGRLEASYRLATLLLGDRHAAEEATHDAVVRALHSSGSLRDRAAFDAWFRRILVNTCRDVGRRRRDDRSLQFDPTTAIAAAPDIGRAQAERDALGHALANLSIDHREVVVLRFYVDLPIDAIARSLGLREGTVKSRLHRALRLLRATYDAEGRVSGESHR